MEELLAPIIFILVFVFIFLFSKLMEFYRDRSLRELVAWSVTGGAGIPLWSEISNAQIKHKLSKEYCIAGDEEWGYAKEIIDAYRKDLIHSYFEGHLKVIKSKYVIRGADYFMLALYAFLSDHQCDYKFLGHDMRKERLEYYRYGDSSPLFDATYALTDFAIVFHKMHYITYIYCKTNDALRDFVPEWNEKNLKEILDTRQIQISRF